LSKTRAGDQRGIFYAPLVNTVRAQIPSAVAFIEAKATEMSTSASRQTVTLSNGDRISARLVVHRERAQYRACVTPRLDAQGHQRMSLQSASDSTSRRQAAARSISPR
jgi:hypothetical protein